MVKIIHSGDFHIDSRFAFLKNEKDVFLRNQSLIKKLEIMLKKAMDEKAVFLISGDLFDRCDPNPKYVKQVVSLFNEYNEVKVFICPGNHDYLSDKSPYLNYEFPENVFIFKEEKLQKYSLNDEVDIYSCASLFANDENHPLRDFSISDNNKINILFCHSMLTHLGGNDLYLPIDKDEIKSLNFDYLALGHIHKRISEKINNTYVSYPGNPEGRGFDELGEKGYLLLEINKGNVKEEYIPCSYYSFHIIDVNLSGLNDLSEMILKVKNDIDLYKDNDCLRVNLVGEVDLSLGEAAVITLNNEYKDKNIFIINKLKENVDLELISKENTLKGIFVKKMLKLAKENKEEQNSDIIEKAMKYGLLSFGGDKVITYEDK